MSKAEATKRDDPIGGIDYKHPAMVTVQLSRQTITPGVTLFGSSVKNSSMVSLKVLHAEMNRSLSRDWVHGDIRPIIEVLLSPMQFAELITSMNIGSGVPGTLHYHNGELYDYPELPTKSEQFREEIQEAVSNTLRSLKEAQAKINKILEDDKPVGKKGKVELKELLGNLNRLANSTLPFIGEQFAKQINKTVAEAKAEVDAFVSHVALETGINTIRENAPQMIGFDKDEK